MNIACCTTEIYANDWDPGVFYARVTVDIDGHVVGKETHVPATVRDQYIIRLSGIDIATGCLAKVLDDQAKAIIQHLKTLSKPLDLITVPVPK